MSVSFIVEPGLGKISIYSDSDLGRKLDFHRDAGWLLRNHYQRLNMLLVIQIVNLPKNSLQQ